MCGALVCCHRLVRIRPLGSVLTPAAGSESPDVSGSRPSALSRWSAFRRRVFPWCRNVTDTPCPRGRIAETCVPVMTSIPSSTNACRTTPAASFMLPQEAGSALDDAYPRADAAEELGELAGDDAAA